MYLKDSPTFDGSVVITGGLIAGSLNVTALTNLTGNATLAAALISDSTTDATSTLTGAIQTDGGLGVVKALWVGGLANIAGAVTLQSTLNVTGAITGNLTGNASGTAATVTGATQAAITTCANLTTVGALGAGSITSGFGAIDIGVDTLGAGVTTIAPSADSAALNVTPTHATYTNTALKVNTTRAANAAFKLIDLQANTASKFAMDGNGDVTATGEWGITGHLAIGTSAIGATATFSGSHQSSSEVDARPTHASYTGTAILVNTTRAANTAFKLVELQANSVVQVSIRGDGAFMLGGITAPVLGSVQTVSFNGGTHSGLTLDETASTSGGVYARFGLAGTEIGSITRNAATSAVLYNTSSDARLKSPITPFADALERVCAIEAGSFTWKDSGETGHGVIAQQLAPIYPDAVYPGQTDADMWSVDYGKLTPLLIGAVQALYAEVQALKHG